MNKFLISILILLVFFVSGIKKFFNFNTTVTGFMKNTNVPINLAQIAIILAIIIEIFVPLITWYEQYTKKQVFSKYAILILIIFTIIATLIYHKNDTSGILKNLSVVGGLFSLF